MHRRTLLHALSLIGLAPITASSQSFNKAYALQIGAETIQVPTPVGFVETSRRSQELWNMALAYSAGDARIAAHYVAEPDLKAFEAGKTVYFRQFMLVQTPKRAVSIVATQAQFDKLRAGTAELQRNLAAKLEPRLAAEVENVSKAVSAAQATKIKVRIGEIVPVSIERNDSKALVYTILARTGALVEQKPEEDNTVSSTAYCFVKGKVVMLVAYRQFRSPQDLQDSRNMANAWANALFAAN
ncbi:MAG: hypothetical protein U1C47_07490 [Hydrogenophaga sp.]|nr:hypothetical protein [Hydrogenophaga sp.]